jgi:uncharacterized protein (UPF0276 family)
VIHAHNMDQIQGLRPAPLGVGLPYLPGIDPALYSPHLIDFVELTPDMLCRRHYGAAGMTLDMKLLETARSVCGGLPIVVHGVELSIGSVGRWNSHYVTMLEQLHAIWPFRWHSEHLHFQTIDRNDGRGETDIGVPLPLPLTQETVALVGARAAKLSAMFDVPFLIENNSHYMGELPQDDGICSESELLNRIAMRGGCGVLLDLHNLHCNVINNGVDAEAELAALDLDLVGEIHIAGGTWADGFYMDSHDGRVPEPVWDMLDQVLPQCPNVGGLVYEIMTDHAQRIGSDEIVRELEKAHVIWNRARVGAATCCA